MSTDDPVRARRARIARAADWGQRLGYTLFGIAVVVFVVGFVTGLTETHARLVVTCLIVGSVALAPAIVAGYAVRAADRADRDHTW